MKTQTEEIMLSKFSKVADAQSRAFKNGGFHGRQYFSQSGYIFRKEINRNDSHGKPQIKIVDSSFHGGRVLAHSHNLEGAFRQLKKHSCRECRCGGASVILPNGSEIIFEEEYRPGMGSLILARLDGQKLLKTFFK